MINSIIRASLENRAVVLLLAAMLTAIGVHSYLRTPVDALPDLSDVQVIVRTPYPGQAPRQDGHAVLTWARARWRGCRRGHHPR